jgi:hypothetical protein
LGREVVDAFFYFLKHKSCNNFPPLWGEVRRGQMKFTYTIEGGDFSKAGHASSSVKKVLKQLNVNSKVIKRIVVAL